MIDRGSLIVFEGCDRSGKTTQCNKLITQLEADGHKAKYLKFPDRTTKIGQLINSYLGQSCDLDDHAIHLLYSANRWEAIHTMKSLINQGTTLIVDRYAYSGVAYTAAKEGFTLDWCKQPDIGLPQPDKVFYLTLSSEALSRRGGFGDERYEKKDIQDKVAQNFQKLKDGDWEEIDADKSVEDLHRELYSRVKQVMEDSKKKALGKLWTNQS
ncbi:hypothetical protein SNE40_000150 [Patella caerulea]|uniref:Thymidylate kinase n=1 Tax=Patella caerulea TaxID=87958 RepID=A0AAN8Q9P3_PATCE